MFLKPDINLKQLAEHVLRLSDFFIDQPDNQTPWHEKYCQLAYRYYYLPLNFLRNEQIISRGQEVGFFADLETTIDWGSGPGTASLALAKNSVLKSQLKNQHLIERSTDAIRNFQDLQTHLINSKTTADLNFKNITANFKKSLLVFSYSLTEMTELPPGWNNFEALMILEPSTQQDGRKLLETRKKLIEQGYTIWAPCIHQQNCPLLTHSKNDWCHDRVHVQAPDWFIKLEEYLPFKNKTITTSYLLARKQKPDFNFNNKARLVGDSLNEKGKTRQLVCRGEQREFLAWMHKEIEPDILPRGDLITLPNDFEIKSNEIRLKTKMS